MTTTVLQETSSAELSRIAIESAQNEYKDYAVYAALARREKNPVSRKALKVMAESEKSHFEFWKKYAPRTVPKISRLKIWLHVFLRAFLGLTFTLKFHERHEHSVVVSYKSVFGLIPAVDRSEFESMLQDEEQHEAYLMGQVREERVKYISFVVLGLADAVVEISGIHAGSLGVYTKTELAGLAGVVAGMAASISMASAAYAQAKQGFEGSAKWGAIYTGISYMVTAIFLALPYFLTGSMVFALGASVTLGVVLVAMLTYYNAVVSTKGFARQFGELSAIILGASFALYLAGTLIRQLLGIVIG
jgi:VIT1/CCC1 family predicted Fe2+/Mn2+ transporter